MRNVVDFPDRSLIEKEASQWVIQFEGKSKPSKKQVEALRAWIGQSPVHREVLIKYARLWNDMGLLSELRVLSAQTREAHSGLTERLLLTPLVRIGQWLRPISAQGWMACASIIAVGLMAFSGWQWPEPQSPQDNVYITSLGESKSVDLADGSILWLNTDTEVAIDFTESARRIELHRGEAHFQVAHDAERPFEVYAGSRMVRAVGTAFSVYREASNIKVTVTEGKVDLAIIRLEPRADIGDSATQELASSVAEGSLQRVSQVVASLEAGQSAVLNDEEDGLVNPVLSYEQQDLARQLSWRDGQLVFAGEPLEEVVREVSRYTQIQIDVVDPEIRKMRVGGQFRVGETEALFDVLESGFGVRVVHLDSQHVQIHAVR